MVVRANDATPPANHAGIYAPTVPTMETKMTGPLEIDGVDTDGVTTPTKDGSQGSSLYLVPIKLNRIPSPREAELLVTNFDRPSQWTSMHRPGIA